MTMGLSNDLSQALLELRKPKPTVLVLAGSAQWLSNISYIFSSEFILKHKLRVRLCDSLCQGINEVESKSYDLVVMDKIFQSLSGEEFIRYVESNKLCEKTLVF